MVLFKYIQVGLLELNELEVTDFFSLLKNNGVYVYVCMFVYGLGF